jgi:hypothetical protein
MKDWVNGGRPSYVKPETATVGAIKPPCYLSYNSGVKAWEVNVAGMPHALLISMDPSRMAERIKRQWQYLASSGTYESSEIAVSCYSPKSTSGTRKSTGRVRSTTQPHPTGNTWANAPPLLFKAIRENDYSSSPTRQPTPAPTPLLACPLLTVSGTSKNPGCLGTYERLEGKLNSVPTWGCGLDASCKSDGIQAASANCFLDGKCFGDRNCYVYYCSVAKAWVVGETLGATPFGGEDFAFAIHSDAHTPNYAVVKAGGIPWSGWDAKDGSVWAANKLTIACTKLTREEHQQHYLKMLNKQLQMAISHKMVSTAHSIAAEIHVYTESTMVETAELPEGLTRSTTLFCV